MTITYADGTVVEALPISFQAPVLRLAVAGRDDVRVFECIEGLWQTEDGEQVQLRYPPRNEVPAPTPEESHFICSAAVARQLMNNLLLNSSELRNDGADPFYVFAAEKRRVRVTVFRGGSHPGANSLPSGAAEGSNWR
jgi:hypothetical protein